MNKLNKLIISGFKTNISASKNKTLEYLKNSKVVNVMQHGTINQIRGFMLIFFHLNIIYLVDLKKMGIIPLPVSRPVLFPVLFLLKSFPIKLMDVLWNKLVK